MRTSRFLLAGLAAATTVVLSAPFPAAAHVVDQQQATGSNVSPVLFDFAQTFTAGISGELDQVDLMVSKPPGGCGASPPGIPFQIRTVSGATPSGTVLRSGTIADAEVPATGPTAPGALTAAPISPVTVTAGTKYAIVVPEDDCYFWHWAPAAYSGGDRFTFVVVWSDGGLDEDFAFRTYARGNTGTMLSCPASTKIGIALNCAVTVGNNGSGLTTTPTGSVGLSELNDLGTFSGCTLNASGQCAPTYTPKSNSSGTHTLFAQYVGDIAHLGSSATPAPTISVAKRASSQSALSCAPATLEVGQTAICSGTVSDADGGTKTSPTGTTSWTSTGAGSFGSSTCSVAPTGTLGVSSCSAMAFTPAAAGTHAISSAYSGDGDHLSTGPSAAATLTVVPASSPPGDGSSPPASQSPPGATGQRAAALKKCKKKRPKPARAKCRKKAKRLPL